MSQDATNLFYLLSSVLFIIGLKQMTHPRTAARGNMISAVAMLVAVVITLIKVKIAWPVIIAGLLVGTVIGAVFALKVEMTSMPELVALFNGLGGAATIFVAAVSSIYPDSIAGLDGATITEASLMVRIKVLTPVALSGLIGAVTLSGSLIAVGKLLGKWKIFWKPVELPGGQLLNAVLLLASLGLTVGMIEAPQYVGACYLGLTLLALVLGVTLVLPIGGADMPVVVALLNSYSGLAAAAAGFVVQQTVLIIAGSLVGASGLILTAIMCKAMNRSLTNVLFGKIDAAGATATADEVYEGKIKQTSADEVAMLFEDARRVCIVPGYGMAVAQAQYAVRDLYQRLEALGVTVDFAIHPVAGRMPGHMNVLLAEVDIPYDKLREMEDMNAEFEQVDVALVIGANDVVNPDGRDNPDSPIAGMPILDVDKAQTVIVVKRSLSPGFAGIPNPLFASNNCLMLFADGKAATVDMVNAVSELQTA